MWNPPPRKLDKEQAKIPNMPPRLVTQAKRSTVVKEDKFFTPFYRALHPNMDFVGEWCIHYSNKVIFVCINKCAGTTLRNALAGFRYDDEGVPGAFEIVDHRTLSDERIQEMVDDYYQWFYIIRDPKTRWLSGLKEFIASSRTWEWHPEHKCFTPLYKTYERIEKWKRYPDDVIMPEHLEIIEENLANNKFIFDDHTLPQHFSYPKILHKNGVSQVREFFKFEDDINSILKGVLNRDLNLPHLNIGEEKGPVVDEVAQALYDRYIEPKGFFKKKLNPAFVECYKKDFELHENCRKFDD